MAPKRSVLLLTQAHYWLDALRGCVAETTRAGYRTVIVGYLGGSHLGNLPLVAVQTQHIRDFLVDQRRAGWSPGFVRLMQTVIAGILSDAMERGLIRANPAASVWRRVPPELRVIRDPEKYTPPPGISTAILERIQAEHPNMARLVMVYAFTGCRRNEALGLQAGDVRADHTLAIQRQWFGAGRVGPPKGRRPRIIDMAADLAPVLVAALIESDRIARRLGRVPLEPRWLFRSPQTGLPYHPVHVTRVVANAATAVAGRRYGPKAFRHAVATALLEQGESPRYVQLLLGHASLSTTMQYVAHRQMRRREAVDRLRNL